MLITKVMHYLLINGSSLFWARDGTSERMISVGTKKGDVREQKKASVWKMQGWMSEKSTWDGSARTVRRRGEEARGEDQRGAGRSREESRRRGCIVERGKQLC